jgi:hypothetical protein
MISYQLSHPMLADLIKIHCLTHRANFPMSRTSRTVVCKEGPQEHVLSNDFPSSGLWVFCCNCQTFIAWENGRTDVSLKECPSCLSSLNPRHYSCDHCSVTMQDFDDQTLRKQHTVLSWGMPQPACPGCHQFPSSTPKVHACQPLGINLATARSKCLFCGLDLDEAVVYGVKKITAKLDAQLAEAQAKARDAEERSRLAEETAQKEIKLRVQAERKAQEIELVALELIVPQVEKLNHGTSPERKVKGHDERNRAGPAKAQPPASKLSKKDKVTIAIYTFIATILSIVLVGLIVWMIRLY